jgi:nucleoside-diphosphate-sugar epimerase
MAALLGLEARVEKLPPRAGDVRHSRADIAAALRDLNYVPWTDLATGLSETIAWFRSRLPEPSVAEKEQSVVRSR